MKSLKDIWCNNNEVKKRETMIKKQQQAVLTIYQLMGEKIFQLYLKGVDVGEYFQVKCDEILNILKEIECQQKELENIDVATTNSQENSKKVSDIVFCIHCGTKAKVNDVFCIKCGNKISS